MRELKFREWNSDDKRMYSYDDLKKESVTIHYLENPLYNSTIMQYTGLKDKNDVEIYEGDIVEIFDDVGYINFSGGTYRINYEINSDKVSRLLSLDINRAHIKVIGNIHENKELVNV